MAKPKLEVVDHIAYPLRSDVRVKYDGDYGTSVVVDGSEWKVCLRILPEWADEGIIAYVSVQR